MQNEPTTPGKKSAHVSMVAQKMPTHRILVVDDDPETRQISVDVLVKSNFEVHAAVDGADGWCWLRDKHFDLVVTDNKMPRMTGVELIEKLRYIRLSLPVIMATGQVPTMEFQRKPWLLPDAKLQRPFSHGHLLVTVIVTVKKVLSSYDTNWNQMEMLLSKCL